MSSASGRFERTDQTAAAAGRAGGLAAAKRNHEPINFDFDAAITRLHIILAEIYADE